MARFKRSAAFGANRAGRRDQRDGVAGLSGVTARRAGWTDYDRDGDLDLLVAGPSHFQLWQNNGDGRFEEVSRAVGLGGITDACDVAAVDLHGDGVTDLIVARGPSRRWSS